MNVGFLQMEASSWLGGRNYLRNLFLSVNETPSVAISPVIIAGRHIKDAFEDLAAAKIIRTSLFDRRSVSSAARRCFLKLGCRDILLERILQSNDISLLSHTQARIDRPTIGWIPDFQHIHLPELFSEEERAKRNRNFMSICMSSSRVVTSSLCVKADLVRFAPKYAHKVSVLQFVAIPNTAANRLTLPELEAKYAFRGPFFLLPNQFWVHKNHRIVIDALSILATRRIDITVLCTGASRDYRDPTFFDSLMQYVKERGVQKQFRVLGIIPFADLSSLMSESLALLNPSRFEGWSTSVEEAKSLGKRIILSNIPVHQEQAPLGGIYFAADDAEGLADAMWSTSRIKDPESEQRLRTFASECLPLRKGAFAHTFQRIVEDAISRHT